MTGLPWDFQTAVEKMEAGETEQRRVESEITTAFKEFAQAEKLYAVALARRMWELKEQGIAVTVTETLAKGDPAIAELKRERNSKEGLKETVKVAAWRTNADRKDVNELINWSKRRELAEAYGSAPEPEFEKAIGGLRS